MSSEHESPEHNRRETERERPTAEAVAADAQYDITLLFDGLFYVCWDERPGQRARETVKEFNEVQIGVLSTAPDHKLSIKLSGQVACPAISSRSLGMVTPEIELPSSFVRAVRKVEFKLDKVDAGGTFVDGDIGDRRDNDRERESIRWLIDFEHEHMHGQKVGIRRGIFKPIIYIRSGQLYTHKVTAVRYLQNAMDDPPKAKFGHVAENIAVRLNLSDTDRALLKVDNRLTYAFAKHPGSGITLCPPFTIHFDNRRPHHKKPEGHKRRKSSKKHHDEESQIPSDLHFYYQALDIGADKWLDLQPDPESVSRLNADPDDDSRGAPPAVCFPSGGRVTTSIPVETSSRNRRNE